MVLLKARSSVSDSDIEAVFSELGRLRAVVPGILAFASGASLRIENLERGFLHGFVVDFADRTALDAYQTHPAHRAAGARLVGLAEGGLDGLLVFDLPIRSDD